MDTKCEESFSAASGESRGAQRLDYPVSFFDQYEEKSCKLTICNKTGTAAFSPPAPRLLPALQDRAPPYEYP